MTALAFAPCMSYRTTMKIYSSFEAYTQDLLQLALLLKRGADTEKPLSSQEKNELFAVFASSFMEIEGICAQTEDPAVTPFFYVCMAYDLSLSDKLALLLAAMPYFDRRFSAPKIEEVILLLHIVSAPSEEDIAGFYLPDDTRRLLFWYPETGESVVTPQTTLKLHTEIVSALFGRIVLSSEAARVCQLFGADTPLDDTALREPLIQSLAELLRQNQREPGVIALCGGVGSGRKFALAAAARQSARQILFVRFPDLVTQGREAFQAILEDIRRVYCLNDFELCFTDIPGNAPLPLLESCLCRVFSFCPTVFVTAELSRASNLTKIPYPVTLFELSPAAPEEALRLFRSHAGPLYREELFYPYAQSLRLLPGDIVKMVATARLHMRECAAEELDREHLSRSAEALCRSAMGELGDFIPLVYSWEDLVVPSGLASAMHLICAHIQQMDTVTNRWGFGKKNAYGRGTTAMFYGPPGTGKTMAAQVIAREVNMSLFRVDLSQLNSKYVGETQKNLAELFDRAKHSNLVLFFDEADSFFAKRTVNTGDTNSRYANSDTSFLLQKIEEYDGLSILCTNLATNIDEAFKRRITYMLNFPFPDAALRRRIWEALPPRELPSEKLDFEFLAGLELSPAAIKSVFTSALYIAAQQAGMLRMPHIIQALKYHYSKYGKLMGDQELGAYGIYYSDSGGNV